MDFVREKSAAKKINQLYLEAVTLLKKNLVIFGSASTFSRAHKLNGPQGKKEVSGQSQTPCFVSTLSWNRNKNKEIYQMILYVYIYKHKMFLRFWVQFTENVYKRKEYTAILILSASCLRP